MLHAIAKNKNSLNYRRRILPCELFFSYSGNYHEVLE